MLAACVTAAVVIGDHVALRATAERTAAQQAVLWKGDWLEVRGAKKDWLHVYDHRHDRGGWIAAKTVKQVELEEASAPAVRAVVDFLRDTPGQESLGIAYAAIYLKVAPKAAIDADVMIELGAMADRLARRASASGDASAAEQIEVARSWGMVMASVEQVDGARICYDGAAFHAGLALGPTPADAATAVLALTEPGCEPAMLGATERAARDAARLALLERVEPTTVGGPMGNELRVRRAEIAAQLAWADARTGDMAAATKHAALAVSAFARVDKDELAEDDEPAYAASAIAVAASRWAALPAADVPGLALTLSAGEPGETCVAIAAVAKDKSGGKTGDDSPAKREERASPASSVPTSGAKCTHGQVWPASLRANKDRSAAVVAVEPLPGWLELWMFRRGADGGWMTDVLAPSTDGPDRGYVELAGWSADGKQALLVREARDGAAVHKSYETVTLATLAVDHASPTLAGTGEAKRWASAEWRGRTLALR